MLTPAVKDALSHVEDVLMRGGSDAHMLWDILTALRGPDSGDHALKMVTTVAIRRAAFPRLAAMNTQGLGYVVGAVFREPSPGERERGDKAKMELHFEYHVTNAKRALDLDPTAWT